MTTPNLLPCDHLGRVFPADLEAAIGANVGKTALISCSYASSEVCTTQDVAALTQVAQEHGILVHLDAVQAAAYLLLDTVPGIVGFGAALCLACGEDSASMATRNQIFIAYMLENIPCSILVGHPEQRLPFHVAFILEGVRSERMIIALDTAGISVSAGSACNVGSTLPNPALRALGFSSEQTQCVLRFSQNHATSPQNLEHTVARTAEAYTRFQQH